LALPKVGTWMGKSPITGSLRGLLPVHVSIVLERVTGIPDKNALFGNFFLPIALLTYGYPERMFMKRVVVSLVVVAAFVAMAVARFAWPAVASHANPANKTTGIPSGNAYIAYVNVPQGPVPLVVGPLVPAYLSCNVSPSATSSNSVANLTIATLGTTAVAQSTVKTTHSKTSSTAQSTAQVANLNLLGGLIKATVLRAQANSTLDGSGASSNANGTTLADLTIGSLPPIKALPGPNTTVELAGLGTVIVNEQKVMDNPDEAHIVVNLVHVHISLANTLGLPIGADIIVGHAETDIIKARVPTKTVSGHAYDVSANVHIGSIKDVTGPLVSTWLPCTGGSSSNRAVTTTPLSLGHVGVITENTSGTINGNSAQAQGNIRVVDVNLLQGLIILDAIDSKASVSWDSNGNTSQNGSTMLVKARIAGLPINADAAPNTRIDLAGLGYIIINEQIPEKTGDHIGMTVNALHIFITTSNLLGLPIGANVIVGHIDVGIQGVN